MGKKNSFKFLDDKLNQQLVGLLKKSRINFEVGKDGLVRYDPEDDETVENDLICSIRDRIFPSWQLLTCPRDWAARYEQYMIRNGIPFQGELSNGELWFLLPSRYRPHRWKLKAPRRAEQLAMR